MLVTSGYEIARVAAPSLPSPPSEYDARYGEQLNNVLRLYFNRLNNSLGQLSTSTIIPPVTNYTVATLPNAATSGAGARTFVTDASGPTFGSAVVGGGAVFVPVYSNGTNWIVG